MDLSDVSSLAGQQTSSRIFSLGGIKAIAFDADDTLWALQNHFQDVEREYCRLLSQYGDAGHVSGELFATETANMSELGYGCKAFIISLVENAVKISGGKVSGSVIGEILSLGKSLLRVAATPLDGVEETLCWLHGIADVCGSRKYRLALFTKGELLDQENKLRRSGLHSYFDHVCVVSDKDTDAYIRLCGTLGVKTSELLMVGNSFKSDIAPALEVGAYAIHVPFHATWAHEQVAEYSHERLWRVEKMSDIRALGLLM